MRRLILQGSACLPILEFIHRPSVFSFSLSHKQKTDNIEPIVPWVSSIYLHERKFRRSVPLPRRLLNCLRDIASRVEARTLRELQITGCTISEDQVAGLVGIAVPVVWDGVTKGNDRDTDFVSDDE